ncbi:response regulator [Pontibacter diazotrophicus]|uniref:Response regulator n=1 Tax=Pontibacter diazotrophicus TaxID=1400979 RepID=A0A3D8L2N7_9BACT|nr:response regulator [Pontibacter diazotrophicus]RDV11487.1 response regulator [Pontibacter diazotrophicus]
MKQVKSILIIDDDAASIYLTRRVLSSICTGSNVQDVQNGLEGLKILKEAKEKRQLPQLILLDIKMQGMGGFAFLEELAKLQFISLIDTKIVLLSASEDPSDVKLAQMHLAAEYVQKPLTKGKLRSILY